MSSIVSGVGKAISGVVKGATKIFKSVTGSTFGRLALLGASVYLGGAALGFWPGPAGLMGSLAGASPVAAEAAGATGAIGEGLGEAAAGFGAEAGTAGAGPATMAAEEAVGGGLSPVAETLASDAAGTGASIPATTAPAVDTAISSPGFASNLGGNGIISSGLNDASALTNFAGANPGYNIWGTAAANAAKPGLWSNAAQAFADFYKGDLAKASTVAQLGNAVRAGFTPNPVDEQLRLEAARRQAIQPNFNVGNVQLPTPSVNAILRRPDGTPVYTPMGTGILSSNFRGG